VDPLAEAPSISISAILIMS